MKFDVDKLLMECFAGSKKALGYEVNFDFEIYFSEVFDQKGGFDVVIGNPPYVRLQQLKKIDAQIVGLLKRIYASASKGNYDIYVVFVEKGLQLLNQCGQFVYIPVSYTHLDVYKRQALNWWRSDHALAG